MPRKEIFSKEPKSRLRKHLKLLGLFLLLASSVLLLTAAINYKGIIYPVSHTRQPSPKKYLEGKAQVYEHGPRNQKRVALTFDADMTSGMYLLLKKGLVKSWYNRPIKETLDSEHAKATIFLGGLWAKAYPKESYELAHDPLIEIGNHSFSHSAFTNNCYSLPAIDGKKHISEVESAQTMIFAATGITPKYFRFPGGCFNKTDVETITKLGLKIVHWDVVAGDGFNSDANSIIRKVESNIQNGSIVVFHIHDGVLAPKTNDALVKIIPDLRKREFEFVTLSEMFQDE